MKGTARYSINESGQLVMPGLLIISGTGRESGKTTLVCKILEKHSKEHAITAIKVSPHMHAPGPGDMLLYDGKGYRIFREEQTCTGKDSAAMLKAGAGEVFYIQAGDKHLKEAILSLIPFLSAHDLLICESGGLRNYVLPDLFFIIHNSSHQNIKEGSRKLILLADFFITRTRDHLDFDLDQLKIRDTNWVVG